MPDDSYEMLPKFGELNFGTSKAHLCHVQSSTIKQDLLANEKYLCTFICWSLSTSALQEANFSFDFLNQNIGLNIIFYVPCLYQSKKT